MSDNAKGFALHMRVSPQPVQAQLSGCVRLITPLSSPTTATSSVTSVPLCFKRKGVLVAIVNGREASTSMVFGARITMGSVPTPRTLLGADCPSTILLTRSSPNCGWLAAVVSCKNGDIVCCAGGCGQCDVCSARKCNRPQGYENAICRHEPHQRSDHTTPGKDVSLPVLPRIAMRTYLCPSLYGLAANDAGNLGHLSSVPLVLRR